MTPSPRTLDRVPAQLFIVASGLIQYIGAALAVGLFSVMEPTAVAWWRVLVGALCLLAWRRPWKHRWSVRDLAAAGVFGLFIVTMNATFYEAISRLPLGVAVSLEFLGPVAVAVLRGRGWVPRLAALLAFGGVASIGGRGVNLADPTVRNGVIWILVAAGAWAGYILVGQRIASTRSGVTNLSIGLGFGALLSAPVLAPAGIAGVTSWTVLGLLIAVGVLSTAIPLSFEAVAMSRVSAPTYALFTALMPATSTIVGTLMLAQMPTVGELIGLTFISVAVWLASSQTTP